MRILALPLYPQEFSSRIRVDFLVPHLERQGFDIEVAPPISRNRFEEWYRGTRKDRVRYHLSELGNRLLSLIRSSSYDVLWIQKGFSLFPWRGLGAVQSLFNGRIVLDIDDNVLAYPPIQPPAWSRPLADQLQTAKLYRKADLVLCGNPNLVQETRLMRKNAEWLPSTIPLEKYPWESIRASRVPSVVWLGTSSNLRYLEHLGLVMHDVCKSFPELMLHVITDDITSGLSTSFPGVNVTPYAWDRDREADQIRKGWVGLMPLPEDPWTTRKSGYKLLQYMACGLPVVASPVGINRKIVEESRAGFLADSEKEWSDALKILLSNAPLRAEMGEKGRRYIEKSFSSAVWADRLAGWFEGCSSRARHDCS